MVVLRLFKQNLKTKKLIPCSKDVAKSFLNDLFTSYDFFSIADAYDDLTQEDIKKYLFKIQKTFVGFLPNRLFDKYKDVLISDKKRTDSFILTDISKKQEIIEEKRFVNFIESEEDLKDYFMISIEEVFEKRTAMFITSEGLVKTITDADKELKNLYLKEDYYNRLKKSFKYLKLNSEEKENIDSTFSNLENDIEFYKKRLDAALYTYAAADLATDDILDENYRPLLLVTLE